MTFKMYKGSDECTADTEQLAVMHNAGWSRTKPAPAPKAKKVVEAPQVKATKEKVEKPVKVAEVVPKKEAPKKVTPKKVTPKRVAPKTRRSAKK